MSSSLLAERKIVALLIAMQLVTFSLVVSLWGFQFGMSMDTALAWPQLGVIGAIVIAIVPYAAEGYSRVRDRGLFGGES